MKQKIKTLLENILKESAEEKPKIKLVSLWQDRYLDKEKQLQKMLSKEVIEGNLNLSGLPIENLGNIRCVKGDLNLTGCKNLKELPEGLKVYSILYLNDCTSLEKLPNNLYAKFWLDLSGCTSLTELPPDLKVGGHNLILRGCQESLVNQAIEMFGKWAVQV